ncbi:MAG TPA: hypothetical protein VF862_13435, partial [Gemmatimonadales bacterium]
DQKVQWLVNLRTPVRRGGLLWPGSLLRIDWYPTESHGFAIGITTPIGDPLAGRGRPIRIGVVATGGFTPAPPPPSPGAEVTRLLDSAAASARAIRQLVVPFLDHDGHDWATADARFGRQASALRARVAARGELDEVRFFHQQITDAFSVAAGSPAAGSAVARQARAIVLEHTLLPYDALLGRSKKPATLHELGVVASGHFGKWLATTDLVAADRGEAVRHVLRRYIRIIDETGHAAAKEWDDPRLDWVPLQLALLPEEHDEQAELDALVERAAGVRFTEGNRVRYLANLHFHDELLQSIRKAEDYHVLWIHDFPAVTDGGIDRASFEQVVDGYLATLAARVEAYDRSGRLPAYFILLDQHYYEARHSRRLMTILENPLTVSAELDGASPDQWRRLEVALARLKAAVAGSKALQAEAAAYGEGWLRSRVKVQVNITNRVDATFWGGGLISTVFGYPDNIMRDHRKIAFYDATEADPWAGAAIYTGMGVGQQYLGPSWDDRSLIVEGPTLLELRQAARELLLSQGLSVDRIPWHLREPAAGSARPPIPPSARPGYGTRAVQLVNGTGYLPKPVNVAKAVLYSLMPPGSVIKIPDSLWNSFFYGGLLVGACLRGVEVSIVAPALANAPSAGFPQIARAWEFMSRMLAVRDTLAREIAAAGGALRLGLYALPPDDNGIASRAGTWARQVGGTPRLLAFMPRGTELVSVMSGYAATRETGTSREGAPRARLTEAPKLHHKVQYLATGPLWSRLENAPEWIDLANNYILYREATYAVGGPRSAAEPFAARMAAVAEALFDRTAGVSGAAGWAMVGSQNQDYRGMFMDGEVGVAFTGAQTLVPLMDLLFMEGNTTWLEDQATLDRLLPRPGELTRRLARTFKDGV